MTRTKAPATGGAEATLKRIDYIEEEAENIQFAIWANRPIGARKMLRELSKDCLLYTSPSPRDPM